MSFACLKVPWFLNTVKAGYENNRRCIQTHPLCCRLLWHNVYSDVLSFVVKRFTKGTPEKKMKE